MNTLEISSDDLHTRLETHTPCALIDVRENFEWDAGHVHGAKHIPIGDIVTRIEELNKSDTIVLYCKMGGRSMRALRILQSMGFEHVQSLRGGITAWSESYPVEK